MSLYIVFGVNVLVALLFLLYTRAAYNSLSWRDVLLALGLLFCPVFIAVAGAASATFVLDFIAPVVILYAVAQYKVLSRPLMGPVLLMWVLLVVAPAVAVVGSSFAGLFNPSSSAVQFGVLLLWLVRGALLAAIFTIFAVAPIDSASYIRWLRKFVFGASLVGIVGVIDYLGIYETSIFEALSSSSGALEGRVLGVGFLGLFRGAVGQLYANTACVATILYLVDERRRSYWLGALLLSLALILLSMSRAGLVGFLVGVLAILISVRRWRIALAALLCGGVAYAALILLPGFLGRFDALFLGEDEATGTRMEAWRASVDVFQKDPLILLFGNGPTNREGVYHLIGTYGAHNEIIDSVFRLGVGGLFVLLILYLKLFKLAVAGMNRSGPQSDATSALLLALLCCNLAISMTQDSFLRDYSSFSSGPFLFALMGCGAAYSAHAKYRSRACRS